MNRTTDCSGGLRPLKSIRNRRYREAAFTLIELMAVIVIIMILVGIVVSAAKYAQTKAARSRTQSEMAAMETALESYKNDNGAYPVGDSSATSSISVYMALAGGPKTYILFKPVQLQTNVVWNSDVIIDAFGKPYYYQYPGVSNAPGFDLWSAGPDGQTNTPDDIVNWRQQ